MFWSSVSIILVGQRTLYCFIPLLYFIDSTYSHNEIKMCCLLIINVNVLSIYFIVARH